MDDEDQVRELSVDECWEMLRAGDLGRLAFRVVDEIHILPINYAVLGESVVFRTAEGTKLLGVVMGAPVALEVDSHDEESAQSVVVRGIAQLLPEDEAHVADDLASLSWVQPGMPKDNVVRIVPAEVTGRQFRLLRNDAPASF